MTNQLDRDLLVRNASFRPLALLHEHMSGVSDRSPNYGAC